MKPAPAIVDRDTKPANDELGDRAAGEVLDVDEAAALLRIHRDTLYNEVAGNRVPHRRLGKLIRFSRSALIRWLDAPTHKDP